jgi:hypothetical protein
MSYRVLLADPPWRYRVWKGHQGRRIEWMARRGYPAKKIARVVGLDRKQIKTILANASIPQPQRAQNGEHPAEAEPGEES